MPKKPTFAQRLRYTFDNTLARGPSALIAWLALATLLIVGLAVIVDLLLGGTSDQLGPRQIIWNLLFQALVPNPPGDFNSPWQFLVIMLLVTLFSLAMVSILIGLLSATIENRVERLRRGRSQVIERDHTVILGWSEQIYSVVSELVEANRNRRHAAIAILGERDQLDMEDDIRHRVRLDRHTRVVCRRGSPIEHADLDLVSPQLSKSIIVLAPDDEAYADATVLKTVLALTRAANRRPEPYNIATVIRNPKNMEVAEMVGDHEVTYVLSGDVIARIIAQTCRQAGLSIVYNELLDFEGDEIYFQEEPALTGKRFGEALLAYENSALLGIYTHDDRVLLGPPMETVIETGDRVIAISEDDDTVRMRPAALGPAAIQEEAIETGAAHLPEPERTLVLGWNWRAGTIIRQLDAYVARGSSITVVAQHATVAEEVQALSRSLTNQEIHFQAADIGNRQVLDGLPIETFNHVILLCYSDTMDYQRADALTMLVLLHLRRLIDERHAHFSLVTEMMDVRNRNLAESTRPDDFIVSERMVNLLLTQVSENPALKVVFDDLLDPGGTEIFLKPANDYSKPGRPVNFYTVVEAARRRGEVALGYRLKARAVDNNQAEGVVVNPEKSAMITFAPEDRVIVLANQ